MPDPRAVSRLPDSLLIGAATAAHQVEGGNVNSDWWAWEQRPDSPAIEPSGDACDHWHRYREDIAMLASWGLRVYRFSVEWARVEPARGWISRAALAHYADVARTCHEHGVIPMVTLHHFTLPRWVAAAGGWTNPGAARWFARYAGEVARALDADWFCTINEINMPAVEAYRWGNFPPGHVADEAAERAAAKTLVEAHRLARVELRRARPEVQVGLSLALAEIIVEAGGEQAAETLRSDLLDPYLTAVGDDDFLGCQAYTSLRVGPDGPLPPPPDRPTTLMGWEDRPEALAWVLRDMWERVEGRTPLFVTENGIATADDHRRIAYVRRALAGVRACVEDGVDVRGYLYWSLLDNFEWNHGYAPTFGLVSVDRTTFTREARASATWLGRVSRQRVPPD